MSHITFHSQADAQDCTKKTRSAYLWTRILNTPFWAVFNMLPFIIYKELHANALQLTVLITLKPMVSIISMYWGDSIYNRKEKLLTNVMWGAFLGHLPFLFYPFIHNIWLIIASYGFYMMLARGVVPAWMEILKINIPKGDREKVFAFGSAFGYVGGGVLPFLIGWILDEYHDIWKWLFPVTALISVLALFFQFRIPLPRSIPEPLRLNDVNFQKIWDRIARPWKNGWRLMNLRRDFRYYQIGFMLGGSGLIIIQPALPSFFVDVLNLSYKELAIALTLCKGIGYAITFPKWAKWMNRFDIFLFNGFVTLVAFLFPFFLLSAEYHLFWLYLAYIGYGVMQAGSELSWHMSGPIFAKDEDSSIYSSVNVVTVGLRGAIVPSLGSLLLLAQGPTGVLLMGGTLCLFATVLMVIYSRQYRELPEPS